MDNKTDSSDQLFTNQKHPKDSSTQNHPEENGNCWKILIVDDKSEAHQVAKLALKRLKFENKALEFYSAFSAQEAREMLRDHTDIALILLDVVMESDHAGLELAQYIRDILTNKMIRIIIRTGQPGKAPEELVFMDYDINDYTTKTELTREKITTAVIGALRSYRDLTTIEHQKKNSRKLTGNCSKRLSFVKNWRPNAWSRRSCAWKKNFWPSKLKICLSLMRIKINFFRLWLTI